MKKHTPLSKVPMTIELALFKFPVLFYTNSSEWQSVNLIVESLK